MTKLVRLAVTIPTDDDVPTEDLSKLLRALIEQHGTGRVNGTEDGPRIHWGAADVRRLVERPQAPARKPAAKKPEPRGEPV